MNTQTLIDIAARLHLHLRAERLQINTERLDHHDRVVQIITEFGPVFGWIQTTEKIIDHDWAKQVDKADIGWVEHAELTSGDGETLQIRKQGQRWLITYLVPDQQGEEYLYLTEHHAIRGQPERALTYRVYFHPGDTRTPLCARLVQQDKE